MTKEEKRDFAMRICQDTKGSLVVTTLYIIDNYLESAEKAFEADDMEEFAFNINRSKSFIINLAGSLDFKYKISSDLKSLYSYANRTLVNSVVKKDASALKGLREMFASLRQAFSKAQEADSRPAFAGATKVYSGLTYNKKSLNDYAC